MPASAVMTGNNAVVTVTLTVNTTGANGVLNILPPGAGTSSGAGEKLAGLIGALLAVVMFGYGLKREKRSRLALAFAAMLLVAACGVGLAGCGSTSHETAPSKLATAPGSYPVNVTASVGGSGAQSALVTITIVKQ